MDGENVLDYTLKLRNVFSPDIKIASLHGKMKAKEKNVIMEAFAAGEIQILVSTTVVEVGVNVPNATVMMVENAERFGWHSFISFAGVSVEGNISHIAFLCREMVQRKFLNVCRS